MYCEIVFYCEQENIATGTVGIKQITISSINIVNLMELRVSLQHTYNNLFPLIIHCDAGSAAI